MLHVIYPCGLICRPFNTLSGELSQILADPVSCLLWIFFPEIHSYLLLLMCSILMFMSIFFIPLVHLCLSMAKSDVAYRAGYLDKWRKEGRGCIKEWRFFFFVVRKKLCDGRLHVMIICQKFQVSEASGLVTTHYEQCSHLRWLFSPLLGPHPVLSGPGPDLLCISGSSTWLQNAVRHTSLPAKTQCRCPGPKQTLTSFHHWSTTKGKSGKRSCWMLATMSVSIFFCLQSPSQKEFINLTVHWPHKKQLLCKAMELKSSKVLRSSKWCSFDS